MRAGWNRRLRDWLWATDPKAFPIVEAVITEQEDAKDLRSDWANADSLVGFSLVDRGGVQLEGSVITELDYSVTPDTDITPLGPSDPLACVVIDWTGENRHDLELTSVVLRVDPQVTASPREVAIWKARAWRVSGVWSAPPGNQVELNLIGECEVRETGTAVHDLTFNFVQDGRGAIVGAPPTLRDGGPAELGYPRTVIALYAYKADNTPAGNCSWRGKASAGDAQSGTGWSAIHRRLSSVDLSRTAQSNAGTGGSFLLLELDSALDFPYIRIGRSSFSSVPPIAFTSHPLQLAETPTGQLFVIAQGEEPSDSSITWELSPDGSIWYAVADGDEIGVGSLSAVPKQTTYQLRATLDPSSTGLLTPVARRFGVQEVSLTDLAGAAVVENYSCGVDPMTLKGEISQPVVRIMKTGEHDYRDYFTTLFATHHIGQVQLRLWIGHPDLPRQHWLHIDTFDVDDTVPADSQGSAVCLSVLGRLRTVGKIPRFDPQTDERKPVEYAGATIPEVYDDLIDSQVGLLGRLRGQGLPETITDTLAKKLTESDAKDEIDRVAALAGCAVISSQGRVKAVQMLEDAGNERPSPETISRAELTPISVSPGFTNRIDEYFVKWGWEEDTQDWGGEAQAVWLAGFEEKLRSRGIESTDELEEEAARWIESEALAQKIANRKIQHHASGTILWEVRCTRPRPYLEPGDVINLETDQFVARNPNTDLPIRGLVSAKGVVSQVLDPMGTHLVVWIKNFTDISSTEQPIIRNPGFIPDAQMDVLCRLYDWRYIFDADTGLVTFKWTRDGLVSEVWVYDAEYANPIPDNPWPAVGAPPTDILPIGTDEYVTTLPSPGRRRFVQFETRDANGVPRWIRRVTLDPPPVATIDDLPDEAIGLDKLRKAAQTFGFSNVAGWVALSYRKVQWGAGDLVFKNQTYSISSGNTGDMLPATAYYVYFDPAISTTAFQVTPDLDDTVGDDKVLVAMARPASNTSQDAFWLPAVGVLGLNEEQISANLAAFNILAANTVTALLMNIGTLSAITADLGFIIAGMIVNGAGTFTLDLDATGTDILLEVTDGVDPVITILADGTATFTAGITATSFTAEDELTVGGEDGMIPKARYTQSTIQLRNSAWLSGKTTIQPVDIGGGIFGVGFLDASYWYFDNDVVINGPLSFDAGGGLQLVSRGASDSGGSGFRLLRVPN